MKAALAEAEAEAMECIYARTEAFGEPGERGE